MIFIQIFVGLFVIATIIGLIFLVLYIYNAVRKDFKEVLFLTGLSIILIVISYVAGDIFFRLF